MTRLQANGELAVSTSASLGSSRLEPSSSGSEQAIEQQRPSEGEMRASVAGTVTLPLDAGKQGGPRPETEGGVCASLVPRPVDPSPIRSPQAVHSAMLPHIAGKELLEIGTRSGDGMLCFARVAKTAVAVEMEPPYCAKLRRRSLALARMSGRNFSVRCERYQESTPDADVYTWWQQVPRLSNEGVLAHLARLRRQGHVRASAEAILLFDNSHGPDVASLRRLRRHFRWFFVVRFDEHALCLRLLPPGHKDRRWCFRAKGTFTVGSVPIGRASDK